MDTALRAGIALFNEAHHHAAHHAWEEEWLERPTDTPDEQLLHGLIQYTAAIYHVHQHNFDGAAGVASSAVGYLETLDPTYRGVCLPPIRNTLVDIAAQPEAIDPDAVDPIIHRGETPVFVDLNTEELQIVACILAEEHTSWSRSIIVDAISFAEREQPDNRFGALLVDFVTNDTHRSLIYNRLAAHVERERHRDASVTGLFDIDDEQ